MQHKIAQMIEAHAHGEGLLSTGVEGFQLFRVTRPMKRAPAVYPRMVCALVRGSKRIYLNGEELAFDETGGVLCCTATIPVQTEVLCSTPDEPLLGFVLNLETRAFTELLIEFDGMSAQEEQKEERTSNLEMVPWREPFVAALLSLMDLLGDPVALPLLGQGRLREVLFELLRSDAGPLFREGLGSTRGLFRVFDYIRSNLSESLTIQRLVEEAGMSRAVLHRKFKEATRLAPMQFVKALRLNEAAMMIAAGTNVSEAAHQVGYESPSQFNREFRREFGNSPRRWAESLV